MLARITVRISLAVLFFLVTFSSLFADFGDVIRFINSPADSTADLTWVDGELYQAIPAPELDRGIYRINPESGIVIGMVTFQGDVPYGLAYDGDYLWQSDPTGPTIYRIHPTSGVIQGVINPIAYEYPLGLAWDGENIWVANGENPAELFKIANNGTVLEIIDCPVDDPFGLTYGAGYLWIAGEDGNGVPRIYQVDMELGDDINSYPMIGVEAPMGLAHDEEYLWLSDTDSGLLRQVDDGILSGPAPPEPFSLLQPVPDSLVQNDTLVFMWQESIDPDSAAGDAVSYTLFIQDANDTTQVDSFPGIEETSFTWVGEDGNWRWFVRAYDIPGHFTRSNETWTFEKNENLVPPTSFSLISPENYAHYEPIDIINITFTWHSSTDADPEGLVQYRFYAESFTGIVSSELLDDTTFTMDPFNFLDFPPLPWEEGLDSEWWVEAYSQDDNVLSEQVFHILYGDADDVPENSHEQSIPDSYNLLDIYPNPFNASLSISSEAPANGIIGVDLFDILGREVFSKQLPVQPGLNNSRINFEQLATGIYFLQYSAPGATDIRKVVLLR